jgi:hypothetical protein
MLNSHPSPEKGVQSMRAQPIQAGVEFDLEKFRLRNFVRKLTEIGEIEVHDEPVTLADLSAVIESTPKATHFKRVGAAQYEMVAAVSGSRKRLATRSWWSRCRRNTRRCTSSCARATTST